MLKEKDIKFIAKQFKRSDKSLLDVNRIFLGYIKADSNELLGYDLTRFDMLDEDLQDLLLVSLKKVYSGKMDEKIFAPKFNESELDNEDSTFNILKNIDETGNFKENCLSLVDKMLEAKVYAENVVFVGAECRVSKDGVRRNLFVGTICPTKQGTTNYIFDKKEGQEEDFFKMTSSSTPIIVLDKPVEGISYPVLTEGTAIRENVVYFCNKKNKPNIPFISGVLGCEVKVTAEQEKILFNSILTEVTGGKMTGKELFTVFEHLRSSFTEEDENEDEIVIEKIEIKKALENADIDTSMELEDAFIKVLGFDNFKFKVGNVLPSKEKKSVSIASDDADIKIKPDVLKEMRQVQDEDGKVYLMIPINESVTTNGVTLPTEQL